MQLYTLLATIGLSTIVPVNGQVHQERAYSDPQCDLCPARTVQVHPLQIKTNRFTNRVRSTVTATAPNASVVTQTETVTVNVNGYGGSTIGASTGLPVVTPNSTLSGATGIGAPSTLTTAPYGYLSSSPIVQITSSTAQGGSVIVETITKNVSVPQSEPTAPASANSTGIPQVSGSVVVLTITQGQNSTVAGAQGTSSLPLPPVYTTTIVTEVVPTQVAPSTITYYSTAEVTIESCAPTVTDCPLRSGSSVIKTSSPVSTSVVTAPYGPSTSTFVATVTQSANSTVVGPTGASIATPSVYVVTITQTLGNESSTIVPVASSGFAPAPVNSTSAPFAPTGYGPGPSSPIDAVPTGPASSPIGTAPRPNIPIPVGTGSAPGSSISSPIGTSAVPPPAINSTSAPFAPTGSAPVPYGYGPSSSSSSEAGANSSPAFPYSPSGSVPAPSNSTATGPTAPLSTGVVPLSTGTAPVPIIPPGTGTAPTTSPSSTDISPIGTTGFPPAPPSNTSVPFRPQPNTTLSTIASAPSGSVVVLTDVTTAYTTECPASTEFSTGGSTLTSTFTTVSQVVSTFQSTITVAAANVTSSSPVGAITGVPSVSLAPEYASAVSDLTSGLPSGALTTVVPSASVNPLVSSYIANLTAALPTGAQPTGAVPTAIPTAWPNGTATSPLSGERDGGLSLGEIFAWIRYIISEGWGKVKGSGEDTGNESGNTGGYGGESYGGKAKRAHPKDVRAGN